MDDEALLAAFSDGTVATFGHPEHVRVAWLLHRAHGAAADVRMEEGIRRIADRVGAPQKFHVTRTLAWMRLVAAADADDPEPAVSSRAFLARHPGLLDRDALHAHFSPELLARDEARLRWVEPDRSALPG